MCLIIPRQQDRIEAYFYFFLLQFIELPFVVFSRVFSKRLTTCQFIVAIRNGLRNMLLVFAFLFYPENWLSAVFLAYLSFCFKKFFNVVIVS